MFDARGFNWQGILREVGTLGMVQLKCASELICEQTDSHQRHDLVILFTFGLWRSSPSLENSVKTRLERAEAKLCKRRVANQLMRRSSARVGPSVRPDQTRLHMA